jgi:hypothetical protein
LRSDTFIGQTSVETLTIILFNLLLELRMSYEVRMKQALLLFSLVFSQVAFANEKGPLLFRKDGIFMKFAAAQCSDSSWNKFSSWSGKSTIVESWEHTSSIVQTETSLKSADGKFEMSIDSQKHLTVTLEKKTYKGNDICDLMVNIYGAKETAALTNLLLPQAHAFEEVQGASKLEYATAVMGGALSLFLALPPFTPVGVIGAAAWGYLTLETIKDISVQNTFAKILNSAVQMTCSPESLTVSAAGYNILVLKKPKFETRVTTNGSIDSVISNNDSYRSPQARKLLEKLGKQCNSESDAKIIVAEHNQQKLRAETRLASVSVERAKTKSVQGAQ